MKFPLFWKISYKTYPPILRVMEKLGVHKKKQEFSRGFLDRKYPLSEVHRHLLNKGFEPPLLAWKDSEEIISLRLKDKDLFQYPVRIFKDGEVRAHYEYAPEEKPWGHILEKHFTAEEEYFNSLLEKYIKN